MAARLHFIVEGQTEETFVKRVLAKHLAPLGVWVDACCVQTGRTRSRRHKGGGNSYRLWRKDICRRIAGDDGPDSYFTTMVDLYGMARLREKFPGFDETATIADPRERVEALELAFEADLGHPRFIPYVQLHEFEALLLSDPSQLATYFVGRESAVAQLVDLVAGAEEPEEIDDGEGTAPSKRIAEVLPEYGDVKSSVGPLVAEKIGLPVLRQKCPHFGRWLRRLERLGGLKAGGPGKPRP